MESNKKIIIYTDGGARGNPGPAAIGVVIENREYSEQIGKATNNVAEYKAIIFAFKKAKHLFNYESMKNGNWPEDFIKKPNLQMRSVWAIYPPKKSEKEFGKHPTQKPVELLKRIILASTKLNAVILDPFTGSSTTGIASEIIGGRKFIGIDTKKEFLDISIKRFKKLGNGDG